MRRIREAQHRDTVFDAVLDVYWYYADERSAAETFLNGWVSLMDQVWNGEVYQNYPSVNVQDYVTSYWGDAWAGLYGVKQKYDPGHAFRFTQEVKQPLLGPGGLDPWVSPPPKVAAALAQPIDYTGGVRAGAQPLAA